MNRPAQTLREAPRATHQDDGAWPTSGLRVDYLETPGGLVELVPLSDHRLTVHASAPVRGGCAGTSYRFTRTRGDVDILPAGLASAWVDEDAATALVLHLSPALLRRVALDIGVNPERTDLAPQCMLRDAQIEHIAWALEAECRAGFPNGRLYTDGLGLALAVHLLRRYASPGAEPARALPPARLQRVTDYIEAHLDQNLSLAQLALVAEVSASHLKTLFKRAMGVPVHAYVIQRRVERARALLERGASSTTQVALDAGFANQSHMARLMRRVLGVTPAALARAARRHAGEAPASPAALPSSSPSPSVPPAR